MNELEIFIVAKTKESSNTTYMEKIFPIEKENIGIHYRVIGLKIYEKNINCRR